MNTGPAGWAFGKGGAIQTIRKTITSAQILVCFTTPIQIIPAPGAGKLIYVIGAIYRIGGTTDYSAVNAGLFYGPPTAFASADSVAANASVIFTHQNVAMSSSAANGANGGGITLPNADILNQPVTFGASDSNPTTGDGDIDLSAIYLVV